jgi:uncharacterized small protein (DUF1192 family)
LPTDVYWCCWTTPGTQIKYGRCYPPGSNAFVIVTSRNQLTVLSVQELADRAAIVDAVIAYATALDARDWETLGALFTDDACWEYSSVFRQVHNTFNGTDVEIR